MPAPKGHAPYAGCEKGGKFGYLGCPENVFTDEELHTLGNGVVQWITEKNNIWMKFYFQLQGIHWNTVEKLRKRSEMFAEYLDMAKSIQESKLLTEPYLKKADQNMARFILARHHKGEWEDKPEANQNEVISLEKTLDLLSYLQSKSNRNEADSSNKTE